MDLAGGSWVDQDQTFTTGALPGTQTPTASFSGQFAGISVSEPVPGLTPAPGVELLSLVAPTGSGWWEMSLRIFRARSSGIARQAGEPIKPMPNGHFMLNVGADLQEVDLACNIIRDVSLAQVNQSLQAHGYSFPPLNTFHHDMLVLPNAHWIALAQVTKDFTDLPATREPRVFWGMF